MTDSLQARKVEQWLVDSGLALRADAGALTVSLLEALGARCHTPNVADRFREWEMGNIVMDLRVTRSGLVNAFLNLNGDFNLSSGIRNSNWFNVHSAAIIGRRSWDRRGAVGTHHYTQVDRFPSIDEALVDFRARGLRIVAAEITPDALPLPEYKWAHDSVVIYGEEQAGLSAELLEQVDDVVFIPARGSVRSLNVATTSGIFSYDYSVKMGLL